MASTMEVINFTTEGRLSLEEVRFAIIDGGISSLLPCTRSIVYMNIRTMEEREFCIQLNREGFKAGLPPSTPSLIFVFRSLVLNTTVLKETILWYLRLYIH